MGERPGIMIYFDVRPAFDLLSHEQKGMLLEAMLEYAQHGVAPQLDGSCAIAWAFVKPKLDYDLERYNARCLQSKYAVYVRGEKRNSREPLAFEDWLEQVHHAVSNDNSRYRPLSDDIGSHPTTTTKSASTSSSTSKSKSTSTATSNSEATTTGSGTRTRDMEFNDKRNAKLAMLDRREEG